MLDADYDSCVKMARDEEKEGAPRPRRVRRLRGSRRRRRHARDRVAAPPRRRRSARPRLHRTLVMEAGLQRSAGRPSSTRPTSRTARRPGPIRPGDRLAREYGAAVICLAIDEDGQARDADSKFDICKRIHDLAVERYGMEPTDLIFDAPTFPLSAGQEDFARTASRRSRPSFASRPSCPACPRCSACPT